MGKSVAKTLSLGNSHVRIGGKVDEAPSSKCRFPFSGSSVLAAMTLAVTMPIMISHAACETVGGYTWEYWDGGDTVDVDLSFVEPRPSGAVTIPSMLGGKPVTSCYASLSEIFHFLYSVDDYGLERDMRSNEAMANLTSVTMPNSVTSIEWGAFYGCTNLASVTIPNSVTNIGAYAFYGCISLTSVTIPNSVKSIGDWAFRDCPRLKSIVVLDGNPAYKSVSGLLLTKDGKSLVAVSSRELTSVTIPNGVVSIGKGAFYDCHDLVSVTIPDSVTNIGVYAFAWCSSLASVTIPNSVTSIEEGAFAKCSSLASVTIPNSVKSIGGWAFERCSSLTSVTIPNSVTSIGISAFSGCSGLKSLEILNDDVVVDEPYFSFYDDECFCYECVHSDWCFEGCTNVINATLPTSILRVGYIYWFFPMLEHLIITPGSTAVVGCGCCSRLESVLIPNSVTSIESHAFYGCSSLTGVTIPNSVTSIGGYAFEDCSSLTSLWIPNSVTNIGGGFYDGCSTNMPIFMPSYLRVNGGEQIVYYPSSLHLPSNSNEEKAVITIKNIRVQSRLDSRVVDIYYDLVSDRGGTWAVTLEISSGGAEVATSSVNGDIGRVSPGKNKHIVWDAGKDWGEHYGSCVATITAGESSASSAAFMVDTRSNFRIDDVTSDYCDGKYGGIGGRKATFLTDVLCDIDFSVKCNVEGHPISYILVNGEKQYGTVSDFTFNVGSLQPGEKLEVVAVDVNLNESKPFRVNLDIAAMPELWQLGVGSGGHANVKSVKRSSEKRVIYVSSEYNVVWLWDAIDSGFKVGNVDLPLAFSPKAQIKPVFESDTGKFRATADVGLGMDIGENFPKAKQKLGKFAEAELDMELSGGRVYQWQPQNLSWNQTGWDMGVRIMGSCDPFEVRIPQTLNLVYFKLGVLSDITFAMTEKYGIWYSDINLDPLAAVKGTAGAGCDGLACVEGYARGGLVLHATLPGSPNVLKDLGLQLRFGWRAVLLGFERSGEWPYTWWWVGGPQATLQGTRLLAAVPVAGATDDFKLISRDYGGRAGVNSAMRLMAAGNTADVSLGDGYPHPAPSLAADGARDYLAYLRDNANRSDINRTELVYRSGASNEWDAATAVWDDGTADFMPKIAVTTNGTVFAAWANVKRALADTDSMETMCTNLEIAVGVRDALTGAWTCTNITDDAALDMTPVLKVAADGSAAVAWVRNEVGAFVGSAESPSAVMAAFYRDGAWSIPVKVADVGTVLSLDLAWNGSDCEIVWSKDGDGDMSTGGDREVWGAAVGGDGALGTTRPTRLSSEGADAARPFVWHGTNGVAHAIWAEKGRLAACDGLTAGATVEVADGVDVPDDYTLIPRPDGSATLAWSIMPQNGNLGADVTTATYVPGVGLTGGTPLLETADVERNLSGAVGSDGVLRVAYESVNVATNAEGALQYGAVELKVYRQEQPCDVGFTADAFSFGTNTVALGETIDINVKVSNFGTVKAKNALFRLWQGTGDDKSILHVTQIDIPPLSSVTVTVPWRVAEGMDEVAFLAEIDSEDMIADESKANNSLVWRPDLGGPQVAFRDVQCINATETLRLVRATIFNGGVVPLAKGTQVNFWRGEVGGELLATDALGQVTGGNEYAVGFSWDMAEITPTAAVERVVIELVPGTFHPVASVEVAAELAHDDEVLSVDTQFDGDMPNVMVYPSVKLTVTPSDGGAVDLGTLTNKVTIVPLDAAQNPRFFKLVSKETGGSVILEAVIDSEAIGIEETVRELVTSKALERLAQSAAGTSLEVNLSTAKAGFHYGVAASGDMEGLAAAMETAALGKASADGVTLTVTRPHGTSAFFKVIVSDRAR